ncbi:glycerophosphodiester phosphodiesterase family protein [Dactylosporangium fulvum]|uniref:Glycerophosphodiester phosphodiesterase family protein n=1 Tax=Dactylosporangium fulvum TaxID=53359 RepID=A0ABY5W0S0_9ACTN|nr:glycerophosphodiester phosphodiesterase family protein [Dactylosporangium fulvum]UWP82634.1 glycerophosphodiester phosphodiesterase family protein [Dactylosporangium fulvum]
MFAHRGSSHRYAEHTLDAYLLAIEEGADGLECDVRLTRDGHLVCLHDSRIDRTSDGRGRVSVQTLADLDRFDFSSWRADLPGSPDELIVDRQLIDDRWRGRVLTLDRLLGVATDAGRPMRLLIETKHPTRHGSAVELALLQLLRRYGLERPDPDRALQVTVMSFSATAIRRVRQQAPTLPTVMLIDVWSVPNRIGWMPLGSSIAGPGVQLLRAAPETVERLHRRGFPVYVWTVNEPDEVDLVVKLKADGIISDRPAYVIDRLRELGLRD